MTLIRHGAWPDEHIYLQYVYIFILSTLFFFFHICSSLIPIFVSFPENPVIFVHSHNEMYTL